MTFFGSATAAIGLVILARDSAFAQSGARQHTIAIGEIAPMREIAAKGLDRFGWNVCYEEPPWESSQDVAPRPGAKGNSLMVRGKPFVVRIEEPADLSDLKARGAVFKSIVDQHRRAGNPPFFMSRQDAGCSHIVAPAYVRSDGKIQAFEPVLDTRISIPPGKRKVGETVKLVLAEISRIRTMNIVEGTIPMNAFYSSIDSDIFSEAKQERARDVLLRVFEEQNLVRIQETGFQIRYGWSLNYSASNRTYYFNCRVVPPAPARGAGR